MKIQVYVEVRRGTDVSICIGSGSGIGIIVLG